MLRRKFTLSLTWPWLRSAALTNTWEQAMTLATCPWWLQSLCPWSSSSLWSSFSSFTTTTALPHNSKQQQPQFLNMATASIRPCLPLTMSLTTAMSQTTQSTPDLCWVCSDNIFPTSFHIFSVRYISSKYFRPEQFSAPGVYVWVLSRSQNVVGPLLAPCLTSPRPGPASVLSPGSLSDPQTLETSNSEQFTTNTHSHQRSNYCKTSPGHTDGFLDKHTFFLFLGKPMVAPPGLVCVCGLLVIAYHAPLLTAQLPTSDDWSCCSRPE